MHLYIVISEMGQAVAGAAGGVAVVFSLWNISTPTGLWITMNQFQLIMLLLLTNSSIPLSIVAYLSGLKTTTCSFNFLPFKNIPITVVDTKFEPSPIKKWPRQKKWPQFFWIQLNSDKKINDYFYQHLIKFLLN